MNSYTIYLFLYNNPTLPPRLEDQTTAARLAQVDLTTADVIYTDSMIEAYDWKNQIISVMNPLGAQVNPPMDNLGLFVMTFNQQRILSGVVIPEFSPAAVQDPVLTYLRSSAEHNYHSNIYTIRASKYLDTTNLAEIINNPHLAQQIYDHFKALGKLVE